MSRTGSRRDIDGGGASRPHSAWPMRLRLRRGSRLRALALGLAVAAAAVRAAAGNGDTPYRYDPLDEPVSEAAAAMAEAAGARAGVLALVNPSGGARAVRLEALDFDDGARLVVGWEDLVGEPILRPRIDAAEEAELVRVLSAHLAPGATVLALPERSRRLVRLTWLSLPLAAAPLDDTLRVPAIWTERAAAIAQSEAEAAGPSPTAEGAALWHQVRDALVAPPDQGLARLAGLASDGPTYLVLHVADAFHLGIGTGDRLAMVLRDLPQGDAHGAARQVKLWQQAGGHAAYALQSLGAAGLRAHFLTSESDRGLTIARLLPFLPAQQSPEGVRLVWQGGGYWVWELTRR